MNEYDRMLRQAEALSWVAVPVYAIAAVVVAIHGSGWALLGVLAGWAMVLAAAFWLRHLRKTRRN